MSTFFKPTINDREKSSLGVHSMKALPHVKASAEVEHFLDRFKSTRNELDDQIEMIKEVPK